MKKDNYCEEITDKPKRKTISVEVQKNQETHAGRTNEEILEAVTVTTIGSPEEKYSRYKFRAT